MERADSIAELLREVGRFQLEGYESLRDSEIDVKADAGYGRTVVTKYDVESEARIFKYLSEHYPDDSFLGEEHGNVKRSSGRYWLLDPIDGTTNFTQGVAYWGPTLARCDARGVAEGWIYFPVLDEMFHAKRDSGATLNGVSIRTSDAVEYSSLTTIATTSSCNRHYFVDTPAKQRILGSLIVNLAYLAKGTFVACYCRAHPWDIAAGVLIAAEAGAVVSCEPSWGTRDLATMDVDTAPSLTLFAQANPRLPPLTETFTPRGSSTD